MIVLQNWQEERLPITYRNFCHKSLLRLKSKFLNWQGSQPTRYKVKLSLNQKYNRTYENIPGETKVRPIFIPWNALNGKQVTLQLTWMTFLQNREVFLTKKGYQWLTRISATKVWLDLKVNAQIDKDLNP